MRENLRHDAVDELVVDLDAAVLLRLLEHVVHERRCRLVLLVPRATRDARFQVPDRRGREEGDILCRIASAPPAGKARILDVADAHARRDVGRRRAVDDHLRAAVVHVVMRGQDGDARRLEPDLKVLRRRARQRAQVQPTMVASRSRRSVRRPRCRSGTLCLPRGRDTRTWSASTCVSVAVCWRRTNNGVVGRSARRRLASVGKRPRGASMTTSSVPALLTDDRVGIVMAPAGGAASGRKRIEPAGDEETASTKPEASEAWTIHEPA